MQKKAKQKKSVYPPVFDVFPSYKGGRTLEYNGYVYEFAPGHHLQNLWGWVAQHRMVAEDKLGRRLAKGEDTHHIDECRTNNHPDNLDVLPRFEHRSHHGRKMGEAARIPLTSEQVADALKAQGGIKPAARELGLSHSTLRRRFPELCAPYQRTSPTKIDNPRDLETILAAAPDPNVGINEIAKRIHIAACTILHICKRLGVKWVKKRRSDIGKKRPTYRGKSTHRSSATDGPGPGPENSSRSEWLPGFGPNDECPSAASE